MRSRRHHNNYGAKTVRSGKTADQVRRIGAKLGIPVITAKRYAASPPKGNSMSNLDLSKENLIRVLKEYLLYVYKWHGDFILDDFGDTINHDPLIKHLKNQILLELSTKNLSETIIDVGSMDNDSAVIT